MFDVIIRDPPDKLRFVIRNRLSNLGVYNKQTPLPNINDLIDLVTACPLYSKIDLADRYFNIRVEERSEKWNTSQTTCGKMKSPVMLQEDSNAISRMLDAMHNICKV